MSNKQIWVEEGFQTSINIAYDLNNEQKIKSFIPTLSSLEVFEDIMLSTNAKASNRARILIGAYGKGKSHIILMLMALLSNKNEQLFYNLLEKIQKVNPLLSNYIKEYISSDNKLLPVIVSGSSASLTQSFLSALQQALKNEDLLELMPDTHFKSVISTIKLWESDYRDTYNKFEQLISISIKEFIVALQEFDIEAYERFIQIFPQLTAGSEFNPFSNVDVVELYESVVVKLKDVGFNGVYIVYDEFSKYLESSISNASISDIKLLQDFAEKCDRSGSNQMHLLLISHKDISNYIDKNLLKEKVDGWRGVSGRFKHVNLHNNFSQMYEIIAAVIKKDTVAWSDFLADSETKFHYLSERFINNGLIENESVVTSCYPLHPIVTFILPRLSEKVAQNERTLFTFLSSNHKYTLSEFLNNNLNEFRLLTPDYIYDYFEPLFRKENYTTDIYKMYSLTTNILRKLDQDSLSAKVIKTISLVYMVEQFEKLPPIQNVIVDTFADSVDNISEIEFVLNQLIDKECIVYLKRSNGYLKLKESSGTDIASEIQTVIEKNRNTLHLKDILNQSAVDSYIYPTAYNDEMELTRYFDFKFIDSNEFVETTDWSKKNSDSDSVGVLYAVVPQNKNELEYIKKTIATQNYASDRVLFAIPKKYTDIEKTAYEYYAVKQLKKLSLHDEVLLDELDIFTEDLEEYLNKYILGYVRPELGMTDYFYFGRKQQFKRKAQISSKLSEICFSKFPNTPVINNETINKDTITTAALNSRNKVVSGLLENNLALNLGLSGTGQDISIMRTTLIRTGILQNELTDPQLNLSPVDNRISRVLEEIQKFLVTSSPDNNNSFEKLYDILIKPDFGYGIKKGIIPIFIAVVLHSFKKYMVVEFKGTEMPITTDLINSINEKPNDYTIRMEEWNDEKAQYIEELSDIFSDYVNEKEKDFNTFSYVVLAMNRWYMSLPKYSKEAKSVYKGMNSNDMKVDKDKIKYLSTLKRTDINTREYLFDDLVRIFHYSEFSINLVSNIKDSKSSFDNMKKGLVKNLATDIKQIFSSTPNKDATLASVVKDFIESLKPQTLEHLYSNGEDKVLELMKTINNDDTLFIERIGKAVTNLRIDDWTRNTVDLFTKELEQIKNVVVEFDKNVSDMQKENFNVATGYKISFVNEDGIESVKTFDKTEYSRRGKLLHNEITVALEEMGHSIPESEKRQILMSILEKMC